ncbi:UbiA family prenyltransferase [[Eubacterium] cellulosolvens]
MSILRNYGKLARVHSAALTGLAPVLGALAIGVLELYTFFIIFVIGLCTHIFGFAFNEYMDLEIDRRSKILQAKPLVSGVISQTVAIFFAFSGVILGYFLLGILITTHLTSPLLMIIFYTLSWVSIGVYDLTSKSVRCSDLALALWTGSLCLFGGFAVASNPPALLYIIAALAFFQLMVQNILAGLKDLPQDSRGKGTTTPLRMGVKYKSKKLVVPVRFQLYIYGLKLVHLCLVLTPFILFWLIENVVQLSIILCLIIIDFLLVFYIFNSQRFKRENLLRAIGLHELLSYSIVPVMLVGIIDVPSAVFLIVLPFIWLALFLKILYGRLLPGI